MLTLISTVCRPESPEEAELREKIEGLKLRVKEGEGEAEIQVPALSTSGSQPNGFAHSSNPPTEAVSGQEAVDMAKKTVEQASGASAASTSDSKPEGTADQAASTSNDAPAAESSAAAVVAGASPPKPANAWAKKPALQLQTTVGQYLQDCETKLKQLSTRLDTEARQAASRPAAEAPAPAAASKPASSRW